MCIGGFDHPLPLHTSPQLSGGCSAGYGRDGGEADAQEHGGEGLERLMDMQEFNLIEMRKEMGRVGRGERGGKVENGGWLGVRRPDEVLLE